MSGPDVPDLGGPPVERMTAAASAAPGAQTSTSVRISSIDALRGFVMFTMIFVNDVERGGSIVPDWLLHFRERHVSGSGMTFVDLVFPAFLFIVGMSIPFALGSRLKKGEPLWGISLHIAARAGALLAIGILMVNAEAGATRLWLFAMFSSSILAFCAITPRAVTEDRARTWALVSRGLRAIGLVGMISCAFLFTGPEGQRIITLSPLRLHAGWYGILGVIGWSYLVAAAVFLVFRTHRTALLGCVAVMLCFYPADRTGAFADFWFSNHIVRLSGTLGSHGVIAVAGMLLGSILLDPDLRSHRSRLHFTLLFIGGFASAALLLNGLYGVSKNDATPSWCLWSCAITAAVWLFFYCLCDVVPNPSVTKPLTAAGQNVLLSYLLSQMLPNPYGLIPVGAEGNLIWTICCALLWAFSLLCLTAWLNRRGFHLRL